MTAQSRRPRTKNSPTQPGFALALLMAGAVATAYLGALAAKWANAPTPQRDDFLPLALYLASAAAMGSFFLLFGFRADLRLLLPALFLYGIGVALQFRFDMYATTTPDSLSAYAGAVGMALCMIAALTLRGDAGRSLLRLSAPLCYIAALAMLGGMIAMGHRFRGGVFLQGGINPTEICKVLLVVAFAPFLANHSKELSRTVAGLPVPPVSTTLSLAALWLLPMLGLVILHDLGMLVLCSSVLGVMLYAATGRKGYLVVGLLLVIGVTLAGYHLTPHVATRVTAWRDPFHDPTGGGWQTLQSLSAMYTGGAWGRGIGAGSPKLIPVASTDFVYAVIAEELGFLGCLLIMAAFLTLFRGAFDTARRQRDDSTRLLAVGLAALLAVQTLLNIGGVTKAIPVTGVPLPFVSRGGSSLVTSFLALGLLLALGADAKASSRRRR